MSANGVLGDPTGASATEGERLLARPGRATWPPRSSAWVRPVTRFVLDRGARRLDGGRALLGGSPLRLFRLTGRGTAVVDAVERGDDLAPAGGRGAAHRSPARRRRHPSAAGGLALDHR